MYDGSDILVVDADGTALTCQWAEYVDANADGIGAGEMADIAAALEAGRTYAIGGGAEPVTVLAAAWLPSACAEASRLARTLADC